MRVVKEAFRSLRQLVDPNVRSFTRLISQGELGLPVKTSPEPDPERRRRYDMFGPEGLRGSGAGAGGAGGFEDLFGAGLGDLFNSFFGGGATACSSTFSVSASVSSAICSAHKAPPTSVTTRQ